MNWIDDILELFIYFVDLFIDNPKIAIIILAILIVVILIFVL